MAFQADVARQDGSAEGARAEADYRYVHALYHMADRIRDRHPRAAGHLEKAADVVLLSIHHPAEASELDDVDWDRPAMERSSRRMSVTFRPPSRRPSLPSSRL